MTCWPGNRFSHRWLPPLLPWPAPVRRCAPRPGFPALPVLLQLGFVLLALGDIDLHADDDPFPGAVTGQDKLRRFNPDRVTPPIVGPIFRRPGRRAISQHPPGGHAGNWRPLPGRESVGPASCPPPPRPSSRTAGLTRGSSKRPGPAGQTTARQYWAYFPALPTIAAATPLPARSPSPPSPHAWASARKAPRTRLAIKTKPRRNHHTLSGEVGQPLRGTAAICHDPDGR